MTRPPLEVADVVQQYGAAYLARYGSPAKGSEIALAPSPQNRT